MRERHEFHNPQNWRNRGYLPHYDSANKYQMITYRLADSLPQELLHRSAGVPPAYEELSMEEKVKYCKLVEEQLDKGYGSCLLNKAKNARIVVDAWQFFDEERYDLVAYVVMPNHVHLLIKTYEGFELKDIVHSWKSFTAKEIIRNERMDDVSVRHLENVYAGETPALPISSYQRVDAGRTQGLPMKRIWQREYWDRFIRNEKHFNNAISYIHENPVKAGLCKSKADWKWSSINFVRKKRSIS